MNARIFISALAVGLFSLAGVSNSHGYDLLDVMLGSGGGYGCKGPKTGCCESPVQKNGGRKLGCDAHQKCGACQKNGGCTSGCGAAQKGCGCGSLLDLFSCGGCRQYACASDCGAKAGKGCRGSNGNGVSQKDHRVSQKDNGVSQKDHRVPTKAKEADQKVNAQKTSSSFHHSVK